MTPAAVAGDPAGTRPARFLTTLARPPDSSNGAVAASTHPPPVSSSGGPPGQLQRPPTNPTIVLVHGFGCTGLEWYDTVAPALIGHGLTVFSYDRILFAEPSDSPAAAARTADRLAAELRALLAARGLEPPFLVVGHSCVLAASVAFFTACGQNRAVWSQCH